MTLRILSIICAVSLMASCGEKAPTACECSEIIKTGPSEANFDKCQELMKDEVFRKEVGECTAKSIIKGGGDGSSMPATESELKDASDGSFQVDIAQSDVNWMGSKAVGKTHAGTLKFYSGEFTIANGLVTGGKFIIDMNTLTNTDLKDEESNAKLVNHLKSADFFDVAQHNTATFVINRAEDSGNGSCLLYGDLTVKGITKPRMAEVILTQRDNTVMIAGILTFDRSEYDVRYGSGKFFDNLGDELIKDEIDLRIKVFAKAPENV